jgi:hypothetical protein
LLFVDDFVVDVLVADTVAVGAGAGVVVTGAGVVDAGAGVVGCELGGLGFGFAFFVPASGSTYC